MTSASDDGPPAGGALGDYLKRRFGGFDQSLIHRRELSLVRRLLKRLPLPPERCLDVPCGYGRCTAVLHGEARPRLLVGADRGRKRLQAASQEVLPGEMRWVQVDLLDGLPFPEASFDLVLSLRFLQHERLPERRAQALAELLRVSARFVIASYYAKVSIHQLQRSALRALGFRRGQPLARLSPAEFASEVAQRGGRVLTDQAVLPGLHGQRLALVEKS